MPQVSLHTCASFLPAWKGVMLPWFQWVSATAWRRRAPTLVVVPCRSRAYYLKALLLEHGLSLLGIRFVTPPELRELLCSEIEATVPSREHLRLLLSVAAEQEMAPPEEARPREEGRREPGFPAAKAVARAPDHLLRAFDQITAAGWSFGEAGPRELHGVVRRFQKLARQCGFSLAHDADCAALEHAKKSAPVFAGLLITGFNAAHWPLWPLLRAGVEAADHATVVLSDPRDEARDLDECWVGAWEQAFGSAIPVDETETLPGLTGIGSLPDGAAEAAERAAHPLDNVHFLVGDSTAEQARAVVAMAVRFLNEKSFRRLGILFSGPGALARSVAALLEKSGIPHQDGIAHTAPGPFEDEAWPAWLELQENPQLRVLLRFLRALPNPAVLFPGLAVAGIEEVLQRAFEEILIDDIAVLREFCARREKHAASRGVADGLAVLQFLPPFADFPAYLFETRKIFSRLGWAERWAEVERLGKGWSGCITALFSRHIFLRWLAEITRSLHPVRDAQGNHPYSRVHLLPYTQAEGEEWSHLILAGLNEGEWPPSAEGAGFLREEDIDQFNRKVRFLNMRAVEQGSQGEGHWSVREGKALCLGPVQQREIALRQLLNTVESAGHGLAVAANLHDESTPGRARNASEFFTRLFFSARGKPLSQAAMEALQMETGKWLQRADLFKQKNTPDSGEIRQTRIAHDARRRPGAPFGEYEFARKEAGAAAVALAATDWERALQSPALVWMKAFLGVEGGADRSDGWSLATGKWIHRWLGKISGAPGENRFADLPAPEEIPKLADTEAHRFRNEVESLLAACDREVPDWWISGWGNALFVANGFSRKLAKVAGWPRMATEWVLESPQILLPGEKTPLRLRGRIDLILARDADAKSKLGYAGVWIVDYKTGNRKGLDLKKLRRGDGLQLALYTLALRELGASSVGVSLLSRNVELDSPQLEVADIESQAGLWLGLLRMQETGIFGMRGPIRSEFNFANNYPLATLAIDEELLQEKWEITHPAFAGGNEEEA